jgi:hypothetical protein
VAIGYNSHLFDKKCNTKTERRGHCILYVLVLNIVLLINLSGSIYKRNLDFIGMMIVLFAGASVYFLLSKTKRTNRHRRLLLTNENLFNLLVVLSITNYLTYIYSTGLDAKLFRSIEYVQAFAMAFLFRIKRFKTYRKFIPVVCLSYILIPPCSVMLDSLHLLTSEILLVILVLCLKILLRLRKVRRIQPDQNFFFILPVFFLIWNGISSAIAGTSYNNITFILLQSILLISAYLVFFSLRSSKQLATYALFLILLYTLKIVLIAFSGDTIPSPGGINNNLYGITFEFLIFLGLGVFIVFKSDRRANILLLFIVLLFIALYRLNSRSPIIAIAYSFILFSVYFAKSKFKDIEGKSFGIFIVLVHMLVLGALFYYLSSISKAESILVRAKIWEFGFRGLESNPINFIFGIGDFGKINLLQWAKPGEFLNANLGFVYETGFFQTHLHSDYLAMLYGGGSLNLLIYFSFIGLALIHLLKFQSSPFIRICAITLIAFSVHGLTEPIVMNVFVSFMFWLTFLFLFSTKPLSSNSKIGFPKSLAVALFVSLSSLTLFLVIHNWNQKRSLQFTFNHPQFRKDLRSPQKNKNKTDVRELAGLMDWLDKNDSGLFKFPLFTGEMENQADISLLNFQITKSVTSLNRASLLYCELFQLQPLPRHFNNVRNFSNLASISLDKICDPNTTSKLLSYDPYKMISPDFY